MKRKRIIAALLALFMAAGLSGCATYDNFHKAFFEEAPGKVIKIGIFEPLTGSDAKAAEDEIKGMELAHALYSKVNGIPVKLVYEDNASNVDMAVSAAKSLVESGVCVVLGSYNSVLSLAGGDVFRENEIPTIAATNTNPIVTQANDYYFRVSFAEESQGVSAARYIYGGLDIDRVAALKESSDDYAKTMIDRFGEEMEKLTGRDDSVTVLEYPKDAEDIAPYIERLAGLGRSTVFFPSTALEASRVIKAAAGLGYYFTWIGPGRWAGIEKPGEDGECKNYLEGSSYITDYNEDAELSPMTAVFKKAWERVYGAENEPSNAAALGFDAYLLAMEGIKNAGGAGGPLLRKALLRVSGLEGAAGIITMGKNGDPAREAVVVQYTGGKLKTVYTVEPEVSQELKEKSRLRQEKSIENMNRAKPEGEGR